MSDPLQSHGRDFPSMNAMAGIDPGQGIAILVENPEASSLSREEGFTRQAAGS